MKGRVAVIGGGVFGATAAIRLARAGLSVELFEKNDQLLSAASGINQYRLHRGYHYPRSLDTAISCKESEASFRAEYGDAVLDHFQHYYAISRRDSLISAADYVKFMEAAELDYREVSVPFIDRAAVELCVQATETIFDPMRLRDLIGRKLTAAGVSVRLGFEAKPADVEHYDFVVVATYASLNRFLQHLPAAQRTYQFEVCEKPVVRLPPVLANKSTVIMDGPFMCMDPLGTDGLSVMGNVVHAIHERSVGLTPAIPAVLRPHMDRGIVPNPPSSRFRAFIESAAEFFPDARAIEHVGSMFTIRTVLPENDATDARPTLVRHVSPRMITVFSGKIGTCVVAAEAVVGIITRG